MQIVEHSTYFEISFKWDFNFKRNVAIIKAIKGARWNPDGKVWTTPLTSRKETLALRQKCGAVMRKSTDKPVEVKSLAPVFDVRTPEPLVSSPQPSLFENPKEGKFVLRPYQSEAVQAGIKHLSAKNKPSIMVLPTGSGKSLIVAKIALNLSGNTIVLQPSKEILEQNWKKLHDFMPYIDAGIFSASFNKKQIKKITFAMIGSVINKKDLFNHFNNIIIDECDLVNAKGGMYKDFLSHLEHSNVLGLTATPYRLASNSFGSELRFITRTNPRIFHSVSYYCQISDLRAMGYLAPLKYYPVKGFDSRMVKANSNGSDFQDDSLRKYYEEIHFDNSIYGVVQRLMDAGRKSILVFTKFVEDSRMVVKHFEGQAAIVTGETPAKERADILNKFKAGKIRVVSNCGVLTVGFDYPELDTIVMARPTKSLRLYYQIVGRALRPHPDKKEGWIVDLCENTKRFGKVEDLKVDQDNKGRWIVSNRGVQMTNKIIE